MSELPHGVPRATPPAPRDSALGVAVRRDGTVLLGRRARRSRFMPGHLAFPGGHLEPGDDGAFDRCVARELREETGLVVPAERWRAAGVRITPPIFPVRFNARIFTTLLDDTTVLPESPPQPEEVEWMDFMPPAEVVAAWRAGRELVPPPVLPVLRLLAERRFDDHEALAEAVRRANDLEEASPRIEFVPDQWLVPLSTPTLPPATHTNAWLVGGGSFLVVDPGADDGAELDRLAACVERRRELGHRPTAVLLTHHHIDHVAGAAETARRLELPVLAHPATLRRVSLDEVETRPVEDGELFDLDGCHLAAHHTPGHAPGHLALHSEQGSFLIAGDLVSGLSTILIDPDHGDMKQYVDSLVRTAALGARRVLPSHGPPLSGKALSAAAEHRRQRELRIVEALGAGETELEAIARYAYEDTPQAPPPLRERQSVAHLRKLAAEGRARPLQDDERRWSG